MKYQLIINGNKDDIYKVMKVDSYLGALRDIMVMLKEDEEEWGDDDGDFSASKKILEKYDIQEEILKQTKVGDEE